MAVVTTAVTPIAKGTIVKPTDPETSKTAEARKALPALVLTITNGKPDNEGQLKASDGTP